ncbi:DEAD/DEAH box helicase [Flavobacterium sp. J372]|nr:DEAD/DEAH box helicase [Flavobacterium sp. J372]
MLDLHKQGFIDLNHMHHLVLDEADQMLDMGFINDVRKNH